MPFEDVAAETNILAGIIRHGRDAFIDVDDFVDPSMLSVDLNQFFLAVAKKHYGAGEERPLDWPSMVSIGKTMGFDDHFDDEASKHFASLKRFNIELETVRPEAAKLFKLHSTKTLYNLLGDSRKNLLKITGDEELDAILSLVEAPITDFSISFDSNHSEGPIQVAHGGREWLRHVIANPVENIGIPSPFPRWNKQIGGGFRPATVSLIGARSKVGKSFLGANIGLHVADLGVPVLCMDLEMSHKQHLARLLSYKTGINGELIEAGQVTAEQAEELERAMDWLESIPYSYESVVSKSFEQQTASMRRWVVKNVPVNESGARESSLIIYDYLKISDGSELSGHINESQMLGFKMMGLLRIAEKLSTSLLSFVQLNRDGDEKESSTVVFGSDRPVMSCANFSILKWKSESEVAEDGRDNGSHKLINIMTRFGQGGHGDYISMHFRGDEARFTEGKLSSEILRTSGAKKSDAETFDEKPKRRRKKQDDACIPPESEPERPLAPF